MKEYVVMKKSNESVRVIKEGFNWLCLILTIIYPLSKRMWRTSMFYGCSYIVMPWTIMFVFKLMSWDPDGYIIMPVVAYQLFVHIMFAKYMYLFEINYYDKQGYKMIPRIKAANKYDAVFKSGILTGYIGGKEEGVKDCIDPFKEGMYQ